METLRNEAGLKHFVVDIGRQSWSNNYCTGCERKGSYSLGKRIVAIVLSASGLMIASRYPVVAAHYLPFPNKKPMSWQMLISYGVMMVKLDLGGGRVGFVANLHLMAFQARTLVRFTELTS